MQPIPCLSRDLLPEEIAVGNKRLLIVKAPGGEAGEKRGRKKSTSVRRWQRTRQREGLYGITNRVAFVKLATRSADIPCAPGRGVCDPHHIGAQPEGPGEHVIKRP